MPFRTCLRCPTPIAKGSLCAEHQRADWKIRNDDRRIRRAVVEAQPSCQCTRDCAWHEGRCGATHDLTADHVVALARGGTNEGERQTLCRRCNAAKGI